MRSRCGRARRGQSGITLIEVLFVVGLAGVLITPMFALLYLTSSQFQPQTLKNRSASQLAIFRTNLVNDWSRARVIRINPTAAQANPALPVLPVASGALPFARMDCRGGANPYWASNTYPVIAIHTHAPGNNTGRRIVYSIKVKPDNKIDIIRRECGHLPFEGAVIGDYDAWADACPNPVSKPDGAICDMSSPNSKEQVVAEDATELRIPVGCNNGNNDPPYEACDANITLVAEDGQATTPRLHQPVVSTGRMIAGLLPVNVGYDVIGRPS